MYKHSPGPWQLQNSKILASDGTEVARVIGRNAAAGPKSVSEVDANAQLLCMAPKLLKTLKLVKKHLAKGINKRLMTKVVTAVIEAVEERAE